MIPLTGGATVMVIQICSQLRNAHNWQHSIRCHSKCSSSRCLSSSLPPPFFCSALRIVSRHIILPFPLHLVMSLGLWPASHMWLHVCVMKYSKICSILVVWLLLLECRKSHKMCKNTHNSQDCNTHLKLLIYHHETVDFFWCIV